MAMGERTETRPADDPDDDSAGCVAEAARAAVRDWIVGHVDRLLATQTQLEEALAHKRDALAASDAGAVKAIVAEEATRVRQLEELRQSRDLWLAGLPCGEGVHSLGEAAAAIEAEDGLIGRIEQVRQQAARIQQQNWTHWVIAQRSAAHFEEMLGLIARRGQTAATYGPESTAGGGLLDFAA